MPIPERHTPIRELRAAVAAAVGAASLRSVAKQIQVSPSGLQYFLEGADVYANTRRKLEAWYATRSGTVSRGAAEAALHVLVQDLPPVRRSEGLRAFLQTARELYGDGGPLPEWLTSLSEDITPD